MGKTRFICSGNSSRAMTQYAERVIGRIDRQLAKRSYGDRAVPYQGYNIPQEVIERMSLEKWGEIVSRRGS
jgi:hypothetical protein